ncbi:MAG: EAL domain-containing protein [Oceanospirillaceae bacterium]
MPHEVTVNSRKIDKKLEDVTFSFLAEALKCFSVDTAWVLRIENEGKSQLKLFSLQQFDVVCNEKETIEQVKPVQQVKPFTIKREQSQFRSVYVTFLQQTKNIFYAIPDEILQSMPCEIKALLQNTHIYNVINRSSGKPALLGFRSTKLLNYHCEGNEFLTLNSLSSIYQDNVNSIQALEAVFNTIDDLDVPILQCDFSSLIEYIDSFVNTQSTQVEIFLVENEAELTSVFNRLSLIYFNQACFRLFKVTQALRLIRLIKKSLQQSMNSLMRELVLAIKRDDEHFHCEIAIEDANQQVINLVLKFKIPCDRAGFAQISISLIDITAQKNIEKAIKETLQRYELVVQGTSGAIWDWDLYAKTVHYSPQWSALRGYEPSEIGNHQDQWVNTIYPEDKERVLQVIEDYFAGKIPVFKAEYRILRKDGGVRWVSDKGIAQRDDTGAVIRMAGFEIDITAQKKSDERLRLGASVFENAAEGIMILNTAREIVDINAAFTDLQGASPAQIIGRKVEDFLLDEKHSLSYWEIWHKLKTDYKWQGEISNKNSSGKRSPIWLTISCVFDANNDITHYVGLMTDISHVKKSEAMMYQLAHHDSLTGLPNRLLLNKRLEEAILHSQSEEKKLAIVFIDLDNFKFVNDGLGHAAGDQLLQDIARTLLSSVRARDMVARIGGDEFVIVLEGIDQPQKVAKVANKLLKNINNHITLIDTRIRVTASMGISIFPQDGENSDTLMSNADAAMYRAKSLGRDNFQFYTQELTRLAVERMLLESNLFDAIKAQQFVLHYQPQYNLVSRKLTGFEALIRWNHPQLGLLGPDKFIPIAEETGFIEDIGTWVIEEACKQASAWLKHGFVFDTIAVNVSSRQLLKGNLISIISNALTKFGLKAAHLEVEITESMIMIQPEQAIDQLHQLRKLGISLAIDDFGTGYSSLSQLKQMPIDHLKIDKSFINDITLDKNDTAITDTIIAMAERMKLKVIAEGVETIEQEHFLIEKKCNEVQGYLYSRPKPGDEISDLDFTI